MDVILFYISTILYTLGWTVLLLDSIGKRSYRIRASRLLLLSGIGLHAASIGLRFLIYGYFPVASLYETIVFLTLSIMIAFMLMRDNIGSGKVGLAILFSVVLINIMTLFLNKEAGLLPSLSNMWLIIHVPFGLGGYSLFTVSFILGIVYIITALRRASSNIKEFETYYKIIFKLILLGEILLLFAIATGAVWAHFAWGSFWGWDPKETWSLITLLMYIIPLGLYYKNKTRHVMNVAVSLIPFIVMLFNYLGVNLLIYGLHSYI